MKKMIFAAVCVVLVSGCADTPYKAGAEAVAKEETYTTTGSFIRRKANSPNPGDTRVVDKEELERKLQNQAANIDQGR